jgi:hypothetical protein
MWRFSWQLNEVSRRYPDVCHLPIALKPNIHSILQQIIASGCSGELGVIVKLGYLANLQSYGER